MVDEIVVIEDNMEKEGKYLWYTRPGNQFWLYNGM